MGASVREVYQSLRDIVNKDQRGFITPIEFNSLAAVAQMSIFNRMFADMTKIESLRKRNLDSARDKSRLKQIKEDLSTFSKTATIIKQNGVYSKPLDLAKIISISTLGQQLLGQTTSIPIDVIYDEEKLHYVLQSNLSAPKETSPVAFLSDSISVYPSQINKISLRYYKQPEGISPITGQRTASLPKFGFTTSNAIEIYDPLTSIDFELPEHYTQEIVMEMASMIGVNLRDSSVYQYGSTETQKISAK